MRCKICRKKFSPRFSSFQKTCEDASCIIEFTRRSKQKEEKQKLQEMKSRVKTLSEWRRDLRIIFNRYIRERDRDLPCISCSGKLGAKYDAGHYYSRGAFPNLAYDPDNCHAQCVRCNQYLSGNLIDYTENLPKRIGSERFKALQERKNDRKSLSIPEIRELIILYKLKTKNLNS